MITATLVLTFVMAKAGAATAATQPPAPPIYVPICIPGHPKCNRPLPVVTVKRGSTGAKK
jgi:hypothetical protein